MFNDNQHGGLMLAARVKIMWKQKKTRKKKGKNKKYGKKKKRNTE